MSDKWYVVHVNTGSEDTVRQYIYDQMRMDKCPDLIKDILVPTETIEQQLKGGRKKYQKKKSYTTIAQTKESISGEVKKP